MELITGEKAFGQMVKLAGKQIFFFKPHPSTVERDHPLLKLLKISWDVFCKHYTVNANLKLKEVSLK